MLDVAVGIFDERALNSAAAGVRHGDGDLLRFESARSYGVFDDGREGFCGGLCDGILLDVSGIGGFLRRIAHDIRGEQNEDKDEPHGEPGTAAIIIVIALIGEIIHVFVETPRKSCKAWA